ncbi:LuxR family transcriptional regulator [Massilia sp. TS11]|uniref:helix-turn-helix transcriptional regulator n=1 Tax=Massilia sp. TS11 TaxID=2908003 RepID=UPI001EDA6E7F|nr:LuxR family transcriptional regulator [Massilia sp. TS11]MCG2584146.1 LuxR family transcriptional regulator [Massilia sp. TS11]
MLFKLARKCGFDHALFGVIPNRNTPLHAAYLASNYPSEWRQTYDRKQLHYVDPTVSHCLHSSLPIVWKPSIFLGERQCALYEQAAGYGLRSGVSLPLHGAGGQFGVLSFVGPDAEHLGRQGNLQELAMLCLLRDYALESAQRFVDPKPDQVQDGINLTERELECLRWAMLGKSSWEISRILRRSEATINFHLSNTKKKFDVQTRQQAVVKAIKLGLLMPA